MIVHMVVVELSDVNFFQLIISEGYSPSDFYMHDFEKVILNLITC